MAKIPGAQKAGQKVADLMEQAWSGLFGKQAPEPPPAGAAPETPPAGAEPPMAGAAIEMPPTQAAIETPVEETIPGVAGYDVAPELLTGRAPPQRNINLDFFDDEETKRVIDYYNRREGVAGPDLEGRRPVPLEETSAKAVGGEGLTDEESLAKMRKILGADINAKWSPEDLVSVYRMLEVQGKQLHDLATELNMKRQTVGELSVEDLAKYQLYETRFVALTEIASTRAAEAGRMLNSLKALSTEGTREYARSLVDVVKGAGGKGNIEQRLGILAGTNPADLEAVSKAARDTWGAKTWDALMRVRYNMMLSSVRTHGANITGSISSGVYENLLINPARIVNNNVEYVARYMMHKTFGTTPMPAENRMLLSEMITRPFSTIMATREAARVFRDVARGDAIGFGKVYNEMGMRMDRVFSTKESGTAGKILDTPTRMLEAEDAFFRTIHVNAHIDMLARRQAVATGRTSKEVDEIYNQLRKNPTDGMKDQAYEYASKLTFTNDPSAYGELMRGIAHMGGALQDTKAGRLILPFVRTPTNLMGYTLETTGLNAATAPAKLYRDLMGPDPALRADALARIEIAAGMWLYFETLWDSGDLTGAAPSNYGLARAREAAGWRPNSIRVNGEYYELSRLDPFGLTLGVIATGHDLLAHSADNDKATVAAASVITIASMITDRSMLAGIGDLESLFQASPETVGKQTGKFIARQATSFITPGLLRDVREMTDPYRRANNTNPDVMGATADAFMNSMRNAVPGWSQNLPPQVDALGYDIVNNGAALWRGLVPIRKGQIEQDPVAAAWIGTNTPVSAPDPYIKVPGVNAQLDLLAVDNNEGWVYRKYQQLVGQNRVKFTQEVLRSKDWKEAVENGDYGPDSPAAEMVQKAVRLGKQAADLEMIKWLEDRTTYRPSVAGKPIDRELKLKTISRDELRELARRIKLERDSEDLRTTLEDTAIIRYTPKREIRGVAPELQPTVPEQPRGTPSMPRF